MKAVPDAVRGDGPCQDCGGENVCWFTDNVLWNTVMGGPDQHDDPGGIVCVTCFVVRAHAAGLNPPAWRLLAEWPWQQRSTGHPLTIP